MTLVELLIVVTIITLLVGISIPLMRTSIRENRIREASRMLNVLVARAKARAAETGRPVAVELTRNAPGSNAVTEIYLAETPNSYTGDILGARCEVFFDPVDARWEITFRDGNSPSLLPTGDAALIKPGEDFRIQFGHRGAFYNAFRDANANYVVRVAPPLVRTGTPPDDWTPPAGFWAPGPDGEWGVAGFNDDGNRDALGNDIVNDLREAGDHWPAVSPRPASDDQWRGLPFQIRLAPRRVSSSVLQLPDGTVVDLTYSGMGIALPLDRSATSIREEKFSGVDFHVANTAGTVATNMTPVRVTFSPGGEIESVSFGGATYPPTGPVHLLVGLLEQMVDQDNTTVTPNPLPWSAVETTNTVYNRNISDPTSIWVSIGYKSGSLTSSENGWEVSGSPPNFVASLLRSREFAQTAQTMGGR